MSEEEDEDMGTDVKEEDDGEEEKRNTTVGMVGLDNGNNMFNHQSYQEQPTPQGGTRRCRPFEEKEITKLRERPRRAITAKILSWLRKHGNYNLRVKADINDVIAALAREVGWVVLPDGTTFPSRSQVGRPSNISSTPVTPPALVAQHTPSASLRGVSSAYEALVDYDACQTGPNGWCLCAHIFSF